MQPSARQAATQPFVDCDVTGRKQVFPRGGATPLLKRGNLASWPRKAIRGLGHLNVHDMFYITLVARASQRVRTDRCSGDLVRTERVAY